MIVMCAAFMANDLCVVAMALLGRYEAALALVVLRGVFIGYGIGV